MERNCPPRGWRLLNAALTENGDPVVESPVVIEGYSNGGVSAAQLRFSRSRAMLVKQYLEARFQLDPRNMGAVALKSSPPYETGHTTWDGICIVRLRSKI